MVIIAQTLAVTSDPVENLGRRGLAYGTGDANGTATGSIATGLKHIDVAFVTNTENNSEDIQVVKNSNDGTEGSVAGTIYFSVADATNNTWDWMAIGLR